MVGFVFEKHFESLHMPLSHRQISNVKRKISAAQTANNVNERMFNNDIDKHFRENIKFNLYRPLNYKPQFNKYYM